MQTVILAFLALITGARTAIPWDGRSLPASFTYEPPAGSPSSAQLTLHSFASSPTAAASSYQQPYNFDFSHLFANQAAATASASAYATNAAQFAQQFVASSSPPVNAQVDQQNLVKYSQYLELLRNAYGIQLPGELGQQSVQPQPEYQLSAYPSATLTAYQASGAQPVQPQPGYQLPAYPSSAPTYQVAAAQQPVQQQTEYQLPAYPTANGQYQAGNPYAPALQTVDHGGQHLTAYAASTASPQQQYQIYQPQTYGQAGQPQQQQVYQPTAQQTYSQPAQAQTYQQLVPQPQSPQPPAQPQYPSPYSATQVPLSSQEYTAPPQQPHYPPPQTIQYPGQQVSSGIPQQSVQQPRQPPQQPQQQSLSYGQQAVPTYQTAALTYPPQHPQPGIQPQQTRPQVYAYRGSGQAVHPTYSSNLASHSSEQPEYESNSVTELETMGSVYGGGSEYPHVIEEIYTPPQTPATARPTTTPRPPPVTTRPRPQTTRPRPQTTPVPQPTTTKSSAIAITSQSLTQQIRRLPAVLYLDSRSQSSTELETLLRDNYGLPLVAFYVDKIGRPQLAQKYLHQLTAHKALPYLFICGTFIGSEQHIQNYHKNGQIPQLIEYVCGKEHKKTKKTTKKTSS